ncbi:MAG: MarR family transcriptional regulator [Pseudomonadota bacterium]
MSTKTKPMPDIEIGQLVDRFMRQIHCDVGRKAPTFDADRIGPAGGMVLMALADQEPVPIHVLVRSISRDKAQITRLLHTLENKGLVAKSQSHVDGRVCILQLTPKGRDTVARLRLALAETIAGLLGPLDHHECDALKSLLRKAFAA